VVGESLAAADEARPRVRIYLVGGLALRGANGETIGERAFPGRQSRRLFVRLAAIHDAVAAAELADDLWNSEWPPAWQVALRALVSKLRANLARVGAAGVIVSSNGTYELVQPPDAWLDLDAAADAIHRAETLRATGQGSSAVGWALAARSIASRSLLPGEEGEWIDRLRRKLDDVRLRALECLADVWIERGDAALAARDATEAIAADPYRESAHRLLIRAHLAAGDQGAAAQAFETCRRVLAVDLGVVPSPATVALLDGIRDGG
jgi:DNA-binding SARP family transcriptional activator